MMTTLRPLLLRIRHPTSILKPAIQTLFSQLDVRKSSTISRSTIQYGRKSFIDPRRYFSSAPPPNPNSDPNSSSSSSSSAEDEDLHTQPLSLSAQLKTVPNLLSLSRLISSPVCSLLLLNSHPLPAFILTLIASATDGIDGWYARKFKCETVLGSYLDPLGDKVFVTFMGLTLASFLPINGGLMKEVVLLWLSRDAALLAAAYLNAPPLSSLGKGENDWTTTENNKVKDIQTLTLKIKSLTPPSKPLQIVASPISKVNTALQFAAIGGCLTNMAFPEGWFYEDLGALVLYLQYFSVVTTVGSGVDYWRWGGKGGKDAPSK